MSRLVLDRSLLPLLVPLLLVAAGHFASVNAAPSTVQSPFPPQLEAAIPFEPTAFGSAGSELLLYEITLRNAEGRPLELLELQVSAEDDGRELAVFDVAALVPLMRGIGQPPSPEPTMLAPGASATIYLMLEFPSEEAVPERLRHRLVTAQGEIALAAIGTHHDALQALGAPVTGSGWFAETGLSNANGHRRGALVLDGRARISRRYAFDWQRHEAGSPRAGAAATNADFHSYGEPVVAVADAVVVGVTDGLAENVPGQRSALPPALSSIPGNRVTLDIGAGQFAHYMHLQPGSLRVKPGDRVVRGQELGRIGNSGDSAAPHLHVEITNAATPLAGEGLPYVIEAFSVDAGGTRVVHREELPREKMLVDFSD